jgi:membrane-bound lytic murein transglycosylase D
MKKHPKILFCITIFFVFWGTGNIFHGFSQVSYEPATIEDDPIVAALDSLYKLDLFERGYEKVNYTINPKYNFKFDSVPHYDEIVYEARLMKLDAASPFDLQYNSVVQGYINMYIMRKRELVSRVMALSQLYFPLFEAALDKYNLPLELKYLAICESALNPMAKSRAGAMGLWQFMYPTGKMFGLKVSSYIDERCDPYKSTTAACEYFQYLYNMFGDWDLVLAAYNCGPGNVYKAIRRSGGKKTYWEIRSFLPKETQGYIPAFIAVNYIMNYTSEHNIRSAIPKKIFLQVDTVIVKKQLSFYQISSMLNIPEEELQYLNPCYRKRVIPVVDGQLSILTLPANKMGMFVNNEANIYNYLRKDVVISQDLLIEKQTSKMYIVKRGENLNAIAKKNGCTVADIKNWNFISSNSVRPGKKLILYMNAKKPAEKNIVIPTEIKLSSPKDSKEISELTESTTKTDNSGGFKYYTIEKGDSLYRIALKNKTTVEEIRRLNNFGIHYNLLPGKKVKVGVM